jgi:hypothetical protein
MLGEPRAGVMRVRRVRKESMSKSWSEFISIEVVASDGSALVIAFEMETMDIQIAFVVSSFKLFSVMIGNIDRRIARVEVVA